MDIEDIKRRVLSQRMHRYPDVGPDLAGAGTARFRQETGRLRVAFASIRPGREAIAIDQVQRFARQRGIETQWIVRRSVRARELATGVTGGWFPSGRKSAADGP